MNTAQKGFTLIELMIVIAIIGILAAIAIPQYQNYVGRANVAAAVQTLSSNKTGLENYVMENGFFPNGTSAAVPESGSVATNDYVAPVPDQRKKEGLGIVEPTFGTVSLVQAGPASGAGAIRIKMNTGNPGIKGKDVQLLRNADGTWTCETTIEDKYVAKACSPKTSLTAPTV
ncbi:pilin [Psychrobacter celer]|uniref:pilin n=1 Tax=Psychrobacter celer TaxID=306572 RepID=UPI003FD5925D